MHTLFIAAHPDDIETMLGYAVASVPKQALAVIATDGEASTLNYTSNPGFVASGKRRAESEAGLSRLGLLPDQQVYLSLPDSNLSDHVDEMTTRIVQLIADNNITFIYTLGPSGYDQHPDHIAAHASALAARKIIRSRSDNTVTVYALSHNHSGVHTVPATDALLPVKLAAMSCHKSQFVIATGDYPRPYKQISQFAIEQGCWEALEVYHPLILQAETYDSL